MLGRAWLRPDARRDCRLLPRGRHRSVPRGAQALPEVHDRTGQGPSDAVDRLDQGHHQLAELVQVAGLGADDHVVGAGDSLGLLHAGDVDDVLATWAALPTSVWMRTYAVTTGTDLLASAASGAL
jgi:hypothetical protein